MGARHHSKLWCTWLNWTQLNWLFTSVLTWRASRVSIFLYIKSYEHQLNGRCENVRCSRISPLKAPSFISNGRRPLQKSRQRQCRGGDIFSATSGKLSAVYQCQPRFLQNGDAAHCPSSIVRRMDGLQLTPTKSAVEPGPRSHNKSPDLLLKYRIELGFGGFGGLVPGPA
jgi:hypothetical protein